MPRIAIVHTYTLDEYLNIKSLSGVTASHLYETRRFLTHYLNYVNFRIDKVKSLQYFTYLKDTYSISTFRKTVYQILKFLRFLKIDWIGEIKLPPDSTYIPKHISKEMIESTINHFENHEYNLRFKALIYLGMDTGLRAEELYQLTFNDIDIDKQIIRINHSPNNGQSTKTKLSRISFFTNITKKILSEYLAFFNNNNTLSKLFPQRRMERKFNDTPIKVKDLRKYFSQEWDRRGGPTSIKKILMGHSLKGDVDLMHYNCQSEEDLKKIYDKVMNQEIVWKTTNNI